MVGGALKYRELQSSRGRAAGPSSGRAVRGSVTVEDQAAAHTLSSRSGLVEALGEEHRSLKWDDLEAVREVVREAARTSLPEEHYVVGAVEVCNTDY